MVPFLGLPSCRAKEANLHDEVAEAWAAPKSARSHTGRSEIFTKVDKAEAHSYTRIPPIEESVTAYLCPSLASLKGEVMLPLKPSCLTAHILDKAYAASAEAI